MRRSLIGIVEHDKFNCVAAGYKFFETTLRYYLKIKTMEVHAKHHYDL